MPGINWEWDIFISYAREDLDWVKTALYEPLLKTRSTMDGRRPRVFMDISHGCIDDGAIWYQKLADALFKSRRIILIISDNYLQKKMCQWELNKAIELDPNGEQGRIKPLLKGSFPVIPFLISHFQCQFIGELDWFRKLCDSMGLVPTTDIPVLRFLVQPSDIPVNYTLPPVQVALASPTNGPTGEEEEICLSCDAGDLQGTTSVKTVNGVATFNDLSISAETPSTRLIATSQGSNPVPSEVFAVLAMPPAAARTRTSRPKWKEAALIRSPGEAVFFNSGQAVAVVQQDRLGLYDIQGKPLLSKSDEIRLPSKLCLLRHYDHLVVLADWSGRIFALADDGRHQIWLPKLGHQGFLIPGDLALDDLHLYAGFWDGMVYRLDLEKERPTPLLRHDSGVQALAVTGDLVHLCGFDGVLGTYRGNFLIRNIPLERTVKLLKNFPDGLLAVGATNLYKIDVMKMAVAREQLPLRGVSHVLGEGQIPVLMDAQGKGLFIDSQLVIRQKFSTAIGVVPLYSDQSGRFCILRHPDETRTLLMDGRTVFSHAGGTLTMTPAADLFALGDDAGIRLYSGEVFFNMVQN